jgi:hypothetical protein
MTAQLTPRTPTSRTGWPVLHTPRWLLAGAVILAVGLVLAALPHRPSSSERVSDLRSVVSAMNTGIESCAGGVTDSITALREIQSGQSHDVSTGVKIANDGAANCSPANSMPMDDLVQYQVPGSLASFHLDTTVNDLVTWGFPLAQRVQTDVASILTAHTSGALAAATAQLHKDQAALDAQRARIDAAISSANRALSSDVPPPALPS